MSTIELSKEEILRLLRDGEIIIQQALNRFIGIQDIVIRCEDSSKENDEIKLDPCPCCGGESEFMTDVKRSGKNTVTTVYVNCSRCGLLSKGIYIECNGITMNGAKRKLAEIWNRRADVKED